MVIYIAFSVAYYLKHNLADKVAEVHFQLDRRPLLLLLDLGLCRRGSAGLTAGRRLTVAASLVLLALDGRLKTGAQVRPAMHDGAELSRVLRADVDELLKCDVVQTTHNTRHCCRAVGIAQVRHEDRHDD